MKSWAERGPILDAGPGGHSVVRAGTHPGCITKGRRGWVRGPESWLPIQTVSPILRTYLTDSLRALASLFLFYFYFYFFFIEPKFVLINILGFRVLFFFFFAFILFIIIITIITNFHLLPSRSEPDRYCHGTCVHPCLETCVHSTSL